MSALLDRFKPTRILLGVALLEVAIDRIAVPLLKPELGDPPGWHVMLAYAGLFFFYFAGTLAAVVIGLRCEAAFRTRSPTQIAVHALLAAAGAIGVVPLVVSDPAMLGVVRELLFAVTLLALWGGTLGSGRDRGIQIGLGVIAIPLLLHVVAALGAYFVWPDETFDGPGIRIESAGVVMLAIAALATPYCFAPRPFARAVTKALPVLVAMAFAATGAVLSRLFYPTIAKAAANAIGVELTPGQADPRLALYLLALATLVWTLISCALATAERRRGVGAGLALIVLGGYGFKYPDHYLLPLVGFALIAEAARGVRDEEYGALPVEPVARPIPDAAWSGYIASCVLALKKTLAGDTVHSLTSRGDEDGMTTTTIVGARGTHPVRVRIERVNGSVFALDVVIGREIDELRGSSLTVWAIPDREHGVNPSGPAATPGVRADDDAFDARFRCRGSAEALAALFDADLRARATGVLDGWLAYWQGEGLRYRIYPGRGAPLDHPMPLSDLAQNKAGSGERLANVVELLADLAERVLPVAA